MWLKNHTRTYERGQALLIVLLSMAVVLTVVLSILSRSVTDIAVTSRSEESVRAFSAAEAGIERAFLGSTGSGNFEGATFNATIGEFGKATSFVYPNDVSSGDIATVWFVAHNSDGSTGCTDPNNPCFTGSQFRLCWGANTSYNIPDLRPAIEVSVFYQATPGDTATTRIARAAYDSNTTRATTNNFTVASTASCNADGRSFPFSATLDFGPSGLNIPCSNTPNCLQYATVRFLYSSNAAHPLAACTDGVNFPSQGTRVESTGKSGESARRVEVLKLFPDIPPIFSSVIFSPSGISK